MYKVLDEVYIISTDDKKVLKGIITMVIINPETGYVMYSVMNNKNSYHLNSCFIYKDKGNAEANLGGALSVNTAIEEMGKSCIKEQTAMRDNLVGEPNLNKKELKDIFGELKKEH